MAAPGPDERGATESASQVHTAHGRVGATGADEQGGEAVGDQNVGRAVADWRVLGAVSAGGALGAAARYAVNQVAGPLWSTFLVNVVGCLLIGVLMGLIAVRWPQQQRLLRPFAGVGVLGGFTTFSAYAMDIRDTLAQGRVWPALVYLAGTAVCALAAVWLGLTVASRARAR